MTQSGDETMWSEIAGRVLIQTVTYPIEYGKILIQIGHEPISPKSTTTLFGKPALALPNIFQYVRYIKKVDGFAGCYRGFAPKFCAYTVSLIVSEKVSQSIEFEDEPDKQIDEDDLSDEDRKKRCIYELLRNVISRVAAILVTHPLDVIALRTMAQFVGGETKYGGFRSIAEVYRDNGISGYYAGIVPRLIANVGTLVLVSASTYALNKYIIRDPDIKIHTRSMMTFLCSTITYPFYVISHCMAVNNCGLEAGRPPQMPIYESWLNCWTHLSSTNQLKRGNSMLWRYYTGPRSSSREWQPITMMKSRFQH